MRNIKLTIEYDGTNFHGWQKQPDKRTVQEEIETVLPDFIIKKYNLMEKREALRQIHFPDDKEKLDRARFSLVFEEFFLIQLKLAVLREENNKNLQSKKLYFKYNLLHYICQEKTYKRIFIQ